MKNYKVIYYFKSPTEEYPENMVKGHMTMIQAKNQDEANKTAEEIKPTYASAFNASEV